jgi:hypothetical protein
MKIEFYFSNGYSNSARIEVFEYPDDITDDEIDEAFSDWVNNHSDMGWRKLDE